MFIHDIHDIHVYPCLTSIFSYFFQIDPRGESAFFGPSRHLRRATELLTEMRRLPASGCK